jgi:hypothetical protein
VVVRLSAEASLPAEAAGATQMVGHLAVVFARVAVAVAGAVVAVANAATVVAVANAATVVMLLAVAVAGAAVVLGQLLLAVAVARVVGGRRGSPPPRTCSSCGSRCRRGSASTTP